MNKQILVLCSLLVGGTATAKVTPLSGAAHDLSARAAQRMVQQHSEQLGALGATVR